MEHKGSESDDVSQSAVNLRACLEELVKFTLYTHSHSLLNNLTLSTHFCSTLLKHDPTNSSSSHSHPQDSLEGLPPYPLYKRLASALLTCMDSEAFCRRVCNLAMTLEIENASMEQKYNEWQKLIMEKGSEIMSILKSVSFEVHVQEPFFSQLIDGLKTIEGRCATGKYNRIELESLTLLNKSVIFEVQGLHWYPTFHDMLEAEGQSLQDAAEAFLHLICSLREEIGGCYAPKMSSLVEIFLLIIEFLLQYRDWQSEQERWK